ncbi:odorant receptor 10a-like [Pogonomyrmex barbatus]|uniref:Odorant receptor n=1 Tax=Pogonomyrmex barbatus TaxID=144034 RepID=A0A6I9WZL3_9HYME|nr:odorant receptor 10a-like [Pogonomyrmex barbatus]
MSRNKDIDYAMDPHKFIILPLGVWPLQKYNTFALIRCIVCGVSLVRVLTIFILYVPIKFFFSCIFNITVMMSVLFFEIVYGDASTYDKLDALMVMFCNLLSILKLLSFRIYAKNLIRNFSSAVDDYHAIDTEEKRIIMRRHAYMGRMVCFSIMSFSYFVPLIFVWIPLLLDKNNDNNIKVQVNVSKNPASELPIPLTWTLGNYEISPALYLVISFTIYVLLMLTCNSNCGNKLIIISNNLANSLSQARIYFKIYKGSDAFYVAIVLHVCGQMELLKIDFTNYGMESNDLSKDFLKLATRHRYLMELAELLVDVISFVLLIQLLCSCLIICLMGFSLIIAMKTNDVAMISKTISVLSALLLQLFFYSFAGDYLKSQMEDIANSIYTCNWYYLPANMMKNLLFVIMRAQQPVMLLAGKFFLVNIETFMVILKSSLSYLSVLRVMVDA